MTAKVFRGIPEGLEQWLAQSTYRIGKTFKKLNCYEQRQRKLRKMQIDIERESRYLRDNAVIPYSLYVEKVNRVAQLQAEHLITTGHYYKIPTQDDIRKANDGGVVI